MAWVMLGIAGIFEVVWATCMKYSEGFTKLSWSLLTFAGMAVSFFLLARATKTLPLGTAYAVWTGIGALGSVIVGIILFKEPVTAGRLIFAALLLIGIIGLITCIWWPHRQSALLSRPVPWSSSVCSRTSS